MLDIPVKDLEEQGVVSEFTAQKMAEQARSRPSLILALV